MFYILPLRSRSKEGKKYCCLLQGCILVVRLIFPHPPFGIIFFLQFHDLKTGLIYRFLKLAQTSKKFAAARESRAPLAEKFFDFSCMMELFDGLKMSTSRSLWDLSAVFLLNFCLFVVLFLIFCPFSLPSGPFYFYFPFSLPSSPFSPFSFFLHFFTRNSMKAPLVYFQDF